MTSEVAGAGGRRRGRRRGHRRRGPQAFDEGILEARWDRREGDAWQHRKLGPGPHHHADAVALHDGIEKGRIAHDPGLDRAPGHGGGGEEAAAGHARAEIRGRTLVQDLAVVDEQDVAATFGFVEVGRTDENPRVPAGRQGADDQPQFPSRDRIDTHGRLV